MVIKVLPLILLCGFFVPVLAQDPGVAPAAPQGEREALTKTHQISVIAILEFMQEKSAKTVQYPSIAGDHYFDTAATIDVLGGIESLSYSSAKSLLGINGYELHESVLDDGRRIISVSHTHSRMKSTVPIVTEIIAPGQDLPANMDKIITLVMPLEFADTNTVIGALRDLLGVGGRGTPGAVSIVNVTSTNTLMVKGKVSILRHVRMLVDHIDRRFPASAEPFHGTRIVKLKHADARELAATLAAVLRGPNVSDKDKRIRLTKRTTHVVPDVRTRKIIVDSTDADELEWVLSLIAELDVKIEKS